ncbi:MAG: molybdopterin molybdotransferase MoeA [Rhizobiaceae bacterium]
MTMPPSLINDCFLHDKDRLLHEEALAILKEHLTPIVGRESVLLENCFGRVVSQDILAPNNVPLHTNSAVDGYAFCHADLDVLPFTLSDRITAGKPTHTPLSPHTTARIFTGAMMPAEADTVAMQEDCVVSGQQVQIPKGLKKGANCRLLGEDLWAGDLVISKGARLNASDIAALASIGMGSVPVFRNLKIGLFSNGNEMRIPGSSSAPLSLGEVYDANQPLISTLCKNLPIELHLGGIIEDSATIALETISKAAKKYDVIITTGGASRGDEDHMLSVLDKLGKRHLWQLAVKPGRPMMFGQIPRMESEQDCLFFGLPGNPVAAMVCFLLYTRPSLLALAGANWETQTRFQVTADFNLENKKTDRREFQRGILNTDETGTLTVRKYERDGSGLISSLREADGLIELSEEVTEVKKGQTVSFIPFSSFD